MTVNCVVSAPSSRWQISLSSLKPWASMGSAYCRPITPSTSRRSKTHWPPTLNPYRSLYNLRCLCAVYWACRARRIATPPRAKPKDLGMTDHIPQVIRGAPFPGVNHHTVWSDPDSGSHSDFSSFQQLAQTAERGFFDFL